ncbi:MAG: geranylgeranyl reductase family protein [Nitrospiraceae bacterium]
MPTSPEAKFCDVLIVGMGPGGATAAFELSRAGLSVVALEKEFHPRYKVCGGGLSARIARILGSDFQSVVEHEVRSVQFSYGGQDPILIDSAEPFAYMAMRDRFDHLLVEKARGVGTEVREGEPAAKFLELPDGIEVHTKRERYRTKVLIGADGAKSAVAQWLFPEHRFRRMPTLESEVDIDSASLYPGNGTALIDFGATNKGYAWIFPKKGRLSIGLGGFEGPMAGPKQFFRRFIADEPGLSRMTVPPPLGHPLPLYSPYDIDADPRLVRRRALLVGDAGHLVDPLFGEGIYYAVRSGQLAAAAILGSFHDPRVSLQEYERTVAKEIYPEFSVAARMAKMVYALPRLCHRLAFQHPDILRLYYDVLRGQETYQTFLAKAKGLLKSSFRDMLQRALTFS